MKMTSSHQVRFFLFPSSKKYLNAPRSKDIVYKSICRCEWMRRVSFSLFHVLKSRTKAYHLISNRKVPQLLSYVPQLEGRFFVHYLAIPLCSFLVGMYLFIVRLAYLSTANEKKNLFRLVLRKLCSWFLRIEQEGLIDSFWRIKWF